MFPCFRLYIISNFVISALSVSSLSRYVVTGSKKITYTLSDREKGCLNLLQQLYSKGGSSEVCNTESQYSRQCSYCSELFFHLQLNYTYCNGQRLFNCHCRYRTYFMFIRNPMWKKGRKRKKGRNKITNREIKQTLSTTFWIAFFSKVPAQPAKVLPCSLW